MFNTWYWRTQTTRESSWPRGGVHVRYSSSGRQSWEFVVMPVQHLAKRSFKKTSGRQLTALPLSPSLSPRLSSGEGLKKYTHTVMFQNNWLNTVGFTYLLLGLVRSAGQVRPISLELLSVVTLCGLFLWQRWAFRCQLCPSSWAKKLDKNICHQWS